MRNSFDVIEIDNYVILSTFQRIIYLLSIKLDLKHAEPNIGKIFKTNIICITKYLNLNKNSVKVQFLLQK